MDPKGRPQMDRLSLADGVEAILERGRVFKDSTSCWVWTAARTARKKNRGGYGRINLADAGQCYAHEVIYRLVHPDGPGYECLLHKCDKPFCVNPEHLQAGTLVENNADMKAKGRARGPYSRPRRSTWDETWIKVAEIAADRSRCSRRTAGSVVVSATNQVLAFSYNGPPAGLTMVGDGAMCSEFCPRAKGTDEPLSYDDCVSAHSEANALMMSDRTERLGGTIYVTTAPCFMCAKLIANSGLGAVKTRVLAQDYYRDPIRSLQLMKDSNLYVEVLL